MKTLTLEEREKYNISFDLETQIKKELLEGAKQGLTYGSLVRKVIEKFDIHINQDFNHPLCYWIDEIQRYSPTLNNLTDRQKRIVQYSLSFFYSNWEDEGQYFDQTNELKESEIEEVIKELFPYYN